MKHISIIVYEDVLPTAVSNTAALLISANEAYIAAVTYSVGYNDLKTFRMIFKRITGLTPIEYRSKYNV